MKDSQRKIYSQIWEEYSEENGVLGMMYTPLIVDAQSKSPVIYDKYLYMLT